MKPNKRIPRNQKSNKNCVQKKREKENQITENLIALTTKEEEEDVEICKEKKIKT